MSTEPQLTVPVVPEVPIHPLLSREIRPTRNWCELLARWQAAKTLDDMKSLLHIGFDLEFTQYALEERSWELEPEYNHVDRLLFYFSVADGWDDFDLLRGNVHVEEEYRYRYNSSGTNMLYLKAGEARKMVAKKAFDMLAQNFFKIELLGDGRDPDDFSENWVSWITAERLFPSIQHFFRLEKSRHSSRCKVVHLNRKLDPRSHQEKLAIGFILNLKKFLWGWRECGFTAWSSEERGQEAKAAEAKIRARLDAAKPWMVELLFALDELDSLREHLTKLDKPCLEKLEEIAMRSELSRHRHPVDKDRPVASLCEARFAGSKAAWLLEEHRLVTSETRRLEDIRQAEYDRAEANKKLKRLTGK